MAYQLDELSTEDIRDEGLDTHVIAKKIPVTVGKGSLIFEIILWCLFLIPGIIFTIMKVKAGNYFDQLQQKLQHDASQIDNYLEQRVVVLQNCARLLDKAIDLDKTTYENIAKYRGGIGEDARNDAAAAIDAAANNIRIAFENYPDLQAHKEISDAMRQNMYLQREITAARELYNDTINRWNRDIFKWPTNQIVAAKRGYTTRIPFIASSEIKQQARSTFF